MCKWIWTARGATLVVSAMGSLAVIASPARAADRSPVDPINLSLESPPLYLDEDLPGRAPGSPESLNAARSPLMALLDSVGMARPLDEAHVNIYGWIEGSYNYNFDNPARGLNLGREFDFNDNRGQINQLNLTFERKADLKQWDIGGMVQMFYGTDGRFTTSSDFLGNGGSEYYFDIPQIYLDLTVPVGNGIRFRFGKVLFFKQIDPNASVFYSHSFAFGAALPFTLTGISAFYPVNDDLSFEAGFSRGWGQTFTDNNSAIDGFGRVKYSLNKQTTFSLALIFGPELNSDDSHYRTVVDATASYAATEQLTFLSDAVYGYQAQPSGIPTDQWYGISGYAVYKCCDVANLNFRAEYYRDEEGFTTGIAQTLFEVTAGLTITPFPKSPLGSNLKIRPEVRWDYSTRPYFNGLTDHSQVTVAVDAYFDF